MNKKSKRFLNKDKILRKSQQGLKSERYVTSNVKAIRTAFVVLMVKKQKHLIV